MRALWARLDARSVGRCGERRKCRAALTDKPTLRSIRVLSSPRSSHHADHRVRARPCRARRVNAWARPPPGRSEAESIDDAEPGASIKDAMVRCLIWVQNATSFRKTCDAGNRFLSTRRPHCSGKCDKDVHGTAGSPARTVRADSDTTRQRWRERPRADGLGSLVRQDSGVVHAIVGSATATAALVVTAAQSAASMRCSRQGAAIETLARRSYS